MQRKVLSFVCSVALVLGMLSSLSFSATAEVVDYGDCGENLFWTLNDEGVLTIDGTGDMYDDPFSASFSRKIQTIQFWGEITSIGEYAFSHSFNLTSISLPSTLKRIGAHAFANSSIEGTLQLNEGLETIGEYAFSGCYSLTNVSVPASVTEIGPKAFGNRPITVASDNPIFASWEGSLYNKDKTKLLQFTGNVADLPSVLPDTLKVIGAYAFEDAVFEEFEIPESVIEIEPYAFSNSNLININIPSNVKSIGEGAFMACFLENVTIENGVISIGDNAFEGCWITSIALPASVTHLGNGVFSGCELASISVDSLNPKYTSEEGHLFNKDKTTLLQYAIANTQTTYAVPDGVTHIEEKAFCWAWHLENIELPESLISIGAYAFYGCQELTSFIVAEGNESFVTVDGNLFTKDGKTLVQYAIGKSDTAYAVPEGVKNISEGAFGLCNTLQKVTLPSGITKIADDTFGQCIQLKEITIPFGVTSIGAFAFHDCPLETVILPSGVTSIGAYAFDGGVLKTVVLPRSLKTVGDCVFSLENEESTMEVFYGGSQEEWENISWNGAAFYTYNDPNVYYNKETAAGTFIYTETVPIQKVENTNTYTFSIKSAVNLENKRIYVAVYDVTKKRLLGMQAIDCDENRSYEAAVETTGAAVYAKVFIWDNMQCSSAAEQVLILI